MALLQRLMVFVFAGVALAGCCASGTGCPVALPSELASTDGLVSSRDDNMSPGEPSIAVGEGRTRMRTPKRTFAEQDAMEQESYAELNKHLQICKGCGSSGKDQMARGDDNMAMNDGMGDTAAVPRAPRPARTKSRQMANPAQMASPAE